MRSDGRAGRAGPRVLCLARIRVRVDHELGALRTEDESAVDALSPAARWI